MRRFLWICFGYLLIGQSYGDYYWYLCSVIIFSLLSFINNMVVGHNLIIGMFSHFVEYAKVSSMLSFFLLFWVGGGEWGYV